MILLKAALLPVLLLALTATAEKPTVKKEKFDQQPAGLFFFDDSETALVVERDAGIVWRTTDAGQEWEKLENLKEGNVYSIYHHPYDNKVAVALGRKKTHWMSTNQGETWRKFTSDGHPNLHAPISWHAEDPKRSWYTTDGFENIKLLQDRRKTCVWAKNTDLFTTGDAELDKNRAICVVEGKYSNKQTDYRLIMTDNFGDSVVEPTVSDGRTVSGFAHLAPAKGYLVAAAKSEGSDEMALYVTDDTKTWHRAQFGSHKLEENAYTILESTNYSIQVDVMSSRNAAMGNLFTSNSNGTYFTRNIEHTNRDDFGFVDFEKVTGIQGVVIVNTVKNYKNVEDSWLETKEVVSRISFDDGRTFQNLKAGDKNLHLHSYTEQRNSGKVFSSPAPGLVMGVGNTGDHLKPYSEGNLWVSDDAGLTWKKALDEAHKYEFGDQGSILVAVFDEGETDKLKYSLNHGKDWDSVDLGDKVVAQELTTITDSTSLKFVLVASKGNGRDVDHYIYSFDFENLQERTCKDKDMETWHARLDEDGKPGCIMGRTQSFRRRKPNAECFIKDEFDEAKPEFETCKCTDIDYECDFNFVRSEDRSKCIPAGPLEAPEGKCNNPDDKFMGSSGWRLIPGNMCDKKGGVVKDEPVERSCSETTKPGSSGEVESTITKFEHAAKFREYYYLERPTSADESETDETVVALDDSRTAHISHDHGKTWKVAVDDEIDTIYPHQYNNNYLYFLTRSRTGYYTKNRGLHDSIHEFKAPAPPTMESVPIMSFHPHEKDWILWTARKDCDTGGDCHSVAWVSTKGGLEGEGSWTVMLPFVQKCQFVFREGRRDSEKLVYCEQYSGEDTSNSLQLLASEDWFDTKTVHYNDVANFATMAEFIVVAKKTEDHKWLKVDASVDGKTFAEAEFPHKFNLEHRQAYTVLDSSTHSVFLHVTMNNEREQEYGTILKSNSNGTEYVLSISEVNRNVLGYVDFEKMQGLEGVALINVVANAEEVDKGAVKKLKSMITHNDGADWSLLAAPEKDLDNNAYSCASKGIKECSLHLHGYTERRDPRDTFSSASAVGLMMGVGNVGDFLGRYKEGDTFITRDGGVTWFPVMKGHYMWEYGDQGSIIVIVEEDAAINQVYYSLDEGRSWSPYAFAQGKEYIVDAISTVPSDTSKNFLLWAKESGGSSAAVTINLDFSGLWDDTCKLDEEDPTGGDYDLWSPKHPMQDDDCLFGHVAQYHRKKAGRKCWNGRSIQGVHNIAKNCTCTRQDFECDYNYERQSDGSCRLVEGLAPPDPTGVCSDPNIIEYKAVTGYRRIPITTCSGGVELDLTAGTQPCPGREEQYHKKHGISGVGLFFAITIPLAVAAAVGWWVWRSWDGKFGRIRLGDAAPSFDSESRWVAWPVAALSALVAVAAAVPMLFGGVWRSIRGRFYGGDGGIGGFGGRTYTSRSSFARGRGDYAVVDPDEGELLGEDSDEEV
ncbi:glycosyl hydrolase [Saccharata proteae CBS 121410]|uniref:Vacuolar protein sorting/targeting protein 10 n=1 Tax=Saccharata proteae CBS 121410 TaxID=1314787 RepID=A0A9P4HXE8_9PEZI|nr:glycosyl hydrolase [Saccharata proteae CBS 121410]